MSSEGKNIDQVFREKAETFNPGNAMLEADWSRIKSLLPVSGEVVPVRRKPYINLLKAVAAAAVITGLFFIVRESLPGKKAEPPVVKQMVPAVKKDTGIAALPAKVGLTDSLWANFKFSPSILWNWEGTKGIDFSDYVFALPTDTGKKMPPVIFPEQQTEPSSEMVLAAFYKEAEQDKQYFEINTSHDTVIHCRLGTEIYIPANTFYTGNGLPVRGEVVFSINEYYTLGDMVAAKLNTTSNGEVLKTGGMLLMQAVYQNTEVNIGGGKEISVKMPSRGNFDSQMQLFLPQENSSAAVDAASTALLQERAYTDTAANFGFTGQINFQWVASGQFQTGSDMEMALPNVKVSAIKVLQPFKLTGNDEMATFLTGHLDGWEKDSIHRVLRQLNPQFKNIKLRSAFVGNKKFITQTDNRLPQYIESVNDSVWIPLNYAARKGLITLADSARVMREFERRDRYNNQIAWLENKYRFSIKKLGWINCDRFYNDTRAKTDFVVDLGADPADFVVRIIFPKINALSGFAVIDGTKLIFTNLPVGEPVTIIAIGAKKGKTVGCFKETVISRQIAGNLQFEEINPPAFKEKLKQLDSGQ